MNTGTRLQTGITRAVVAWYLTCWPVLLAAAEYVQRQGKATLRLQADQVEKEAVEIRLSGELLLTISVEGQAPLRVGPSDEEVQREQLKALLASGAWRQCRLVGNAENTSLGQDRERWQQTFRLDPQRTGQVDLQPAPLSYAEGPEQQAFEVKWQPIPVRVTTEILNADVSELRDITPIEELPPGWSWRQPALWLGLAFVVLAPAVALGQFLWRRGRRSTPVPPDRWALRELERMATLALPAVPDAERYHTLLSDVVRRYVELRFGLHAPQQTTAEFLQTLDRASPLTSAQQALLREFLQHCDLAKFAQAQPSPAECQAAATMARKFVEQTALAAADSNPR